MPNLSFDSRWLAVPIIEGFGEKFLDAVEGRRVRNFDNQKVRSFNL